MKPSKQLLPLLLKIIPRQLIEDHLVFGTGKYIFICPTQTPFNQMVGKSKNPANFWQELNRRKVIRRNMVYAASGFVILELASIIADPFGLPDWTLKFVFIILCIGFFISIILSWFYDFTPDGLAKIKPTNAAEVLTPKKPTGFNAWKLSTYISILVIIGLVILNIVRGTGGSRDIQKLEKSIAVLPFENMSVDEEYSYMGDAMTDEIILELQKIEEFDRVLTRTSTMQFQDNRPTIPEIAEKLGVNYIIEGSIQRHEGDVSIRIQVIHAKHEDYVWGNEYDGKWEDIFSFQDEIALKVADELKMVLSPEEIERIEDEPTHNTEAYNLYLKAHYFQNIRSEEGLAKAVDYYHEAIRLDPDYALPYSGLAHSYILQIIYGYSSKNEFMPKAKEAAEKALALDDNLAEAHFSLALVRWTEFDFVGAEEEYKLAIKLNPKNAGIRHNYSYLLSAMGKHNEAIQEANTAQDLEPVNPVMLRGLGWVYYFAREYDLAIKECHKCLEIDPRQNFAYIILFGAYNQKSMYDDAITALENYLIAFKKEDVAALISKTYEESGYIKAITKLLDVLLEQSIGFASNPFYKPIFFTLIGEKDKAFEFLQKSYEQGNGIMNFLSVEPMYDGLRSDTRFQDLIERMNYPEY